MTGFHHPRTKTLSLAFFVFCRSILSASTVEDHCLYCSGYQFMNGLTRVPRVGVHVFMTARVFWTIFEFFLSYLVEIFGFAIVFHILLPQGKTVLVNQGDTKRCRLSWLTISALVYEPKCGGRKGVAGLCQ
jgi:hypothetical protein